MRPRPFTTRLALAVSLAVASTAVAALPAHATIGPPGQPYALNLSTDPATTDFGHRTVDVSGVLTTADGTPVVNGAVVLTESVVFATWNPWGDPIDPYYGDDRALGTFHTDQNGRFTLPGALIDHVGDGSLIQALHTVELNAEYDPDGDPATYNSVYDSIDRDLPTVRTTLTSKADRTRVHAGDVLTVSGTVTVPPGYGSPEGTEVFLRSYWEDEWNARTTADAAGHYTIRYTVRGYDQDFSVQSAPKDLYLAGDSNALTIHNPVGVTYSDLSAAVDRNGLATVKGRLNQGCYEGHQEKVNLQFATKGSKVWRTVASTVNDAEGRLKATYKGGNGSYRWSHPETDNCVLSTSASRSVNRWVVRVAGFHGTPQPVRKGQKFRLNGTLQYLNGTVWQHRGKHPVEIWYRRTGSSAWVRKAVVDSNASGAFQKTVTATTDGWWRAVEVGEATTYTAISASDWIDVR